MTIAPETLEGKSRRLHILEGGIHSVEAHGPMLIGYDRCHVGDPTGCLPGVTGCHLSTTVKA